jgi:hypothetical protein
MRKNADKTKVATNYNPLIKLISIDYRIESQMDVIVSSKDNTPAMNVFSPK